MKKGLRFGLVVLTALFLFPGFSGCPRQYDPRDIDVPSISLSGNGGEPLDSLKGTIWIWDSPYGMRTLTFHSTDMTVMYLGQDGDDYTESYTYDGAAKTGTIKYYGDKGFLISADNQSMHFVEWKNYGHGCDFILKQD
jgi:hypothetical protein